MYVAEHLFLTKGVGIHQEKLVSFELALRDARIAPFNLIRVSSILPPHCRIISLNKGLKMLRPGQVVHAVIAEASSNEHRRLMAASIGVAVPRDQSRIGYLSEHHAFGQDENTAGDYAEDLAAQMLATVLGLGFDINQSYNQRLDYWKLSDEIVKTRNITQASLGKKDLWTTVVASAVLVPPKKT